VLEQLPLALGLAGVMVRHQLAHGQLEQPPLELLLVLVLRL
jgi:hypothetical protein